MQAKPTAARWTVFCALLFLGTINYVDRAVLSICMPAIQRDLALDPALAGLLMSAFFWGYASMQIPVGWLADRLRPDRLLAGSAVLWGLFQIATGFLTKSSWLVLVRVLLGISEAPMYPASAKMQSIWLTSRERGRGAALFDSGAAMGNAISGPLVLVFMAWFGGWRGAMFGTGILTLLAAWIAWPLIRGNPESCARMNQAEREQLQTALAEEYEAQDKTAAHGVGIRHYLRSANFWLMCLGYYCVCAFWFGIMTWGPSYLAAERHLDIKGLAGAVFLIFGTGVVVEVLMGWLTDLWRQRGARPNTVMRSLLFVWGIGMAAGIYWVTQSSRPAAVLTWLTIAVAFERVAGMLYWSIPASIAQRKDVGTVAGCMNMAGNAAGVITPLLIGVLLRLTGSYRPVLLLFIGFGLAVSLVSLLLNYEKKVGVSALPAAQPLTLPE